MGPWCNWKTRTFQRRNFPGSIPGGPTKLFEIYGEAAKL